MKGTASRKIKHEVFKEKWSKQKDRKKNRRNKKKLKS
jgi:hypothetical protein